MAVAIFSFGGKKYELSDCINKSIIPSLPAHKNNSQNIREFVSNTNGNEGLQGYFPLFPLLEVSQ